MADPRRVTEERSEAIRNGRNGPRNSNARIERLPGGGFGEPSVHSETKSATLPLVSLIIQDIVLLI
jgi:hypothetical protein